MMMIPFKGIKLCTLHLCYRFQLKYLNPHWRQHSFQQRFCPSPGAPLTNSPWNMLLRCLGPVDGIIINNDLSLSSSLCETNNYRHIQTGNEQNYLSLPGSALLWCTFRIFCSISLMRPYCSTLCHHLWSPHCSSQGQSADGAGGLLAAVGPQNDLGSAE